MCGNYRVLCPVGHGGFDVEYIDETTVVFDCGSCPMANVNNCIIHYKEHLDRFGQPLCIDYLFLSHFDQDHVNGLEMLSKHFKIRNIIVPYIPKKYRVLYNCVTNYAVSSFYQLLNSGNLAGVKLLGTNPQSLSRRNYQSVKSKNQKWEWVYKSLFSPDQWQRLKNELCKMGISVDNSAVAVDDDEKGFLKDFSHDFDQDLWDNAIEEIQESFGTNEHCKTTSEEEGICVEDFDIDSYHGDVKLTKEQMGKINGIIGSLFGGSFAKNENGLLMLSKKLSSNVETFLFTPFYEDKISLDFPTELSACIYTGDMKFDVKSCPTILDFLRIANEQLLLFQIPHHGSSHSISSCYLRTFPSELFFWHDKDYDRINKNTSVVKNIPSGRLILIDTVLFLACVIHLQP